MNVELAKTAGFCFGVKRAVDTVYKQIEKHQSEKIFTYGPIIHNEEVIKDLRSHGVEVLNDEEELKTVDADVVVIRSHGVAKYIYDIMDERGITCVDATCPFVKKIHKIVAEESAKGSYIVIIGNGEHPEVEGIRGWAGEQVTVIQTPEEAERFELPEKEQRAPSGQEQNVSPLRMDIQQIERERMREALEKAQGNKTKAMELLGISRRTFYKKYKLYGFSNNVYTK